MSKIISEFRKLSNKKRLKKMNIGSNCNITDKVIFHHPENIIIGNNTLINGGMIIAGETSKVEIGNDCLISYNVHIRTTSHNYKKKNELIRNQGHFEKDIIIEDDVWIGFGAQIMPGVTLHKGCVVGAGAVVTKDVSEYTVVAGVPAVKISERSD